MFSDGYHDDNGPGRRLTRGDELKRGRNSIELQPLFILNGSGGRIRTSDLRVMSPTSYRTAPPRVACRA